MNQKSKIITSAAAAFGLAVGTAGVIGYRNIDDQWQELNDSKQQVQQEQSQAQKAIDLHATDILDREVIADQKLVEAKRLRELSKKTERIANEDMDRAKKQIVQSKLAQKNAEQSEQNHLDAHKATNLVQKKAQNALVEYKRAQQNINLELAKTERLQESLAKQLKLSNVAEAKAKKAESTTVWYQNKAKKKIAQAECEIATAKQSRQKSLAAQSEADRVFDRIDQLEDLLEKTTHDADALSKHNRKLKCEIRDLDKDFHALEHKFHKLEKVSAAHCVTINKQKSSLSKHDGKIRVVKRLLDAEIAESKNHLNEVKRFKSNALVYKASAIKYQNYTKEYQAKLKSKTAVVNKQRDQIRRLEQELRKKK